MGGRELAKNLQKVSEDTLELNGQKKKFYSLKSLEEKIGRASCRERV